MISRIAVLLAAVVAVCCLRVSFALDTAMVVEPGRRIQLDGILLDWSEKSRRVWKGSGGWVWDAVNTPEGLAGYAHCCVVACSTWTLYIDPYRLQQRPWTFTLADSSQSSDRRFSAVRTKRDSLYAVTFEWIIPWDSLALDSSGGYAVHLTGESECADTLEPVLLQGVMPVAGSMLPPRFVERVLLIIALLVVFIVLQFTVRRTIRRRGSLRRSA